MKLRMLLKRFARSAVFVLKQSALKFGRDKCFLKAQALAYSTLLAFIPTAFAALSLFPSAVFFERVKDRVKDLIFRVFLPSAAEKIVAYIDEFLRNATQLGVLGLVSFLISSLLYLETIDKTFGDIWRTRRRPPFIRLALFWSFLTIPPVLMALSFYFDIVFKMKFGVSVFPAVLPYFIAAVAFSVIYLVFPADDVKPRYAIITGFFVAILWEFAREGFGFYVSKTIAYKTIYGSLWVVPMFMFWLYLVWTIILFGAEMVFVMQWPYGFGRLNLFKLLLFFKTLIDKFESGEKPLERTEAMRLLGIDKAEFEALMDRMESKGWIVESDETIGLGRSLKFLKASELLEVTNTFEEGDDAVINEAVRQLKSSVRQELNHLTLYDLLRKAERESRRGRDLKQGLHRSIEGSGIQKD